MPKKFETIVSDIVYVHGVRPEIPRHTEVEFFERVIREKTEHSIASQQRALELELIAQIRYGLPETNFLIKLKKWVKELKQPTPSDLLATVKRKVHAFDQKPLVIQERIVQEARASQLGEKVSVYLENFFESELKRRKGVIELMVALGGKTGGVKEENRYYQWMLDNLKRPGNRKFLTQKAIEWFGRKQ